MSRKQLLGTGLGLALAVSVILFAGCGKNQATSPAATNTQQTEDLNAPNGGLSATNEQPGFGDANLVQSVSQEAAPTEPDPAEQDTLVQHVNAGTTLGAKVYAVSILWGMLQSPVVNGSTADSGGVQYDWSGSVAVDRGVEVLRRTVAFEAGDHMGPRTSLLSRELDWTSHTAGEYDGIRFLVYEPPSASKDQGPTITFDTPMYKNTWPVSALAQLDTLITVDNNGNMVHIVAFETTPSGNGAGFIRGHWLPASGSAVANFTGTWVAASGETAGYVRGFYGTNSSGEKVFFGKTIDLTGMFTGFVTGSWDVTTSHAGVHDSSLGTFRGHWFSGHGADKGEIKGDWGTATGLRSLFLGEWCAGCTLY